MTHIDMMTSIQEVIETLDTYSGGNLTAQEQEDYKRMEELLHALEAEWSHRVQTDEEALQRQCEEDGEPIHPQDVKQMSSEKLTRAMHEVDEERKLLMRRVRKSGGVWSEEDKLTMDAMDAWAKKVFDELRSR